MMMMMSHKWKVGVYTDKSRFKSLFLLFDKNTDKWDIDKRKQHKI